MKHILVLANETASGQSLIERLAGRGPDLVTVIAPVSAPAHGYVVYDDTRRAAAGRRLDKTLSALRGVGMRAHGMVVDAEPVDAVRDALATIEPPVTSIVVSTHPEARSGWLRTTSRARAVAVASSSAGRGSGRAGGGAGGRVTRVASGTGGGAGAGATSVASLSWTAGDRAPWRIRKAAPTAIAAPSTTPIRTLRGFTATSLAGRKI